MADDIQNAGRKGYCLMYFAIGFLLFICLVVWVYRKNLVLDFPI